MVRLHRQQLLQRLPRLGEVPQPLVGKRHAQIGFDVARLHGERGRKRSDRPLVLASLLQGQPQVEVMRGVQPVERDGLFVGRERLRHVAHLQIGRAEVVVRRGIVELVEGRAEALLGLGELAPLQKNQALRVECFDVARLVVYRLLVVQVRLVEQALPRIE